MDKTLLEILACPVCKSSVLYQKQSQELVCKACRVAYPIRDEIPVMLIDEARVLAAEETY
ncbi:Trm112 family protein [Methylophaga pinxianii]|uniref:Trm112 family protein n=1 Tax=Methylophaga pinxianii TaxID=2881052 RepID=UPI001CF2A238|nr:Trm112 family protein [Methylophaga pinxianii]MCB2426323.1 Trm112 family protein [Methylophaga pinxianii]UPH46671.1 Trm112 family protein [Methylophaga pinxianii]